MEQVPKVEMLFSVTRELRMVPLNWRHPKDANNNFIPLMDRKNYPYYPESDIQAGLEEGWLQSREELESMFAPDFSSIPPEEMGICAYQSTNEGTPISPVFPDTTEGRLKLIQYVVDNEYVFGEIKADGETWAMILFGNAQGLVNPENGTTIAAIVSPDSSNPK